MGSFDYFALQEKCCIGLFLTLAEKFSSLTHIGFVFSEHRSLHQIPRFYPLVPLRLFREFTVHLLSH